MCPHVSAARRYPRNGAGDAALTAGVVALVFSLVPIVGEYVAIPAAVAATVLGLIGFIRADQGLATNPWKALIGAVLGLVAGFILFISFAAMGTFG